MVVRAAMALLCLGACLGLSTVALADGVRLGIENHTWNSLYGKGGEERAKQTFYERNLDQYARLGANWNVVRVDQTSDGEDGFKRLDRILREHERRKIDVVLRLIEDPVVYAELGADNRRDGSGVTAYAQWVRALTRFVGGRVGIMLIGNEVDKDLSANLPKDRRKGALFAEYAAYKRLLTIAHDAIKAVNPGMQVGDHGTESYSLLSAVLADMFAAGQDDAAVALCRRAFWDREEYAHECSAFKRRLRLDAPLKARAEKARLSFTEPGPADLFQLHAYMSADGISAVLDWIDGVHKRKGTARPLIATEVGYLLPASRSGVLGRGPRVADRSRYSETEHAAEMVKSVTVLAGRGVRWIEVWEMRTLGESSAPVATLLQSGDEPARIQRYAAADAFENLAHVLTGKTAIAATLACQGACRQYGFEGAGERVTIAWSDGEAGALSLSAAEGVVVTDVLGEAVPSDGERLNLSSMPIIVRQGSGPR